jgi:hypothetical protein
MATYSNLFIDQGSDFSFSIDLQGVSLSTNYSARGQMRKSYNSVSHTDFTTSVDTTNNELDISLDAITTQGLKAGRYVYDVEIVNSTTGEVTRVLEGQVEVTPTVTSSAFDDIASEEAITTFTTQNLAIPTDLSGDNSMNIRDSYAFIELNNNLYHQNGFTTQLTVTGKYFQIQNPTTFTLKLFLTNEGFVNKTSTTSFGTSVDGFPSTATITSQGAFNVALQLSADTVGTFKYLGICAEDANPGDQVLRPFGKFQVEDLAILPSLSYHPDSAINGTVDFKVGAEIIDPQHVGKFSISNKSAIFAN